MDIGSLASVWSALERPHEYCYRICTATMEIHRQFYTAPTEGLATVGPFKDADR
jgi:hypothetical protein